MRFSGLAISKRFGALAALDGVSLTVDDREILGIAGPNGAGKSTLFDVMSGHLRADEGTVHLNGQDVTHLPAYRRSRLGLGRTFQSPIVPTELTVAEALTASRLAWPAAVPEGKVDEVRDLLGFAVGDDSLAGLLDTLARRKLLLACLLLRGPSVLLLDEPCSGLLAGEIDEMGAIIRRLRAEMAAAVLVVEHRLELLSAIADRVMVMDRGKVIVEGPPTEAFADPAVQRAYFIGPRSAA